MKLHFYLIEKPWENNPYIKYDVVEAEEKPKAYIINSSLKGICMDRILKSEVGVVLTHLGVKVVLCERDDEMAKQLFSEYYKKLIFDCEKKIENYKETIQMIKDWRN